MRVALCDDDKAICSQLEIMVETYFLCHGIQGHIDVFYSAESLQKHMEKDVIYNILFMDIEMEGMSGVEFGRFLREDLDNEQIEIIYISWQSAYAMDLFRIRPVDFLIKPLEKEKIHRVLAIALKNLNRKDTYFVYSTRGELGRVKLNNILYFSSVGRKVRIHTLEETIEFYGKLDEIMERLDHKFFWRIHKSCVINYYQSKKFDYSQVMMTNGTILSISQKHRVAIRNKQRDLLR